MISQKEITEQNKYMRKQYENFRLAAEYISKTISQLSFIEKIALFGSVALPLQKEIPRFYKYRKAGVEILHECKDVDLAIWLNNLDNLNKLRKANVRALNKLLKEKNIGIAHHQVDIFIMEKDTNRYMGRLCSFNECPKGKLDCHVTGCGNILFLKQIEDFSFFSDHLDKERSIVLYQRPSNK